MRPSEEVFLQRFQELHDCAPGTVGSLLDFRLLSWDVPAGEYVMQCKTLPWMRNFMGTLHGGICATILDQAMGYVAYGLRSGEGTTPTVELQVSYHHPLLPEEDVLVKVFVASTSRHLMHFRAEAYSAGNPQKLCLSSTGIFFNKSS